MNPCRKLHFLSILVLLLFFVCSFAGEEKKISKLPKTVEEAVDNILSTMQPKDKFIVKDTKKSDLIKFHHGWGTGIRNEFGLWKGNNDLIMSACGKPCHPDDASMIIIEAVWEELQKKSPSPLTQVKSAIKDATELMSLELIPNGEGKWKSKKPISLIGILKQNPTPKRKSHPNNLMSWILQASDFSVGVVATKEQLETFKDQDVIIKGILRKEPLHNKPCPPYCQNAIVYRIETTSIKKIRTPQPQVK